MQHSENEAEYTPDVFDSFKVLDWDQETNEFGGDIEEYDDVKMSSMFPILFANQPLPSKDREWGYRPALQLYNVIVISEADIR